MTRRRKKKTMIMMMVVIRRRREVIRRRREVILHCTKRLKLLIGPTTTSNASCLNSVPKHHVMKQTTGKSTFHTVLSPAPN